MVITKKELTNDELLVNKTIIIIHSMIALALEKRKDTFTPEEIFDYIQNIPPFPFKFNISLNDVSNILEMSKQRCCGLMRLYCRDINDENSIIGYGMGVILNCIE
jgi:hypothetical protein